MLNLYHKIYEIFVKFISFKFESPGFELFCLSLFCLFKLRVIKSFK